MRLYLLQNNLFVVSTSTVPSTKQNIKKALMVCFRLKRHVLNCFIFSDYDSLRDVRKKTKENDRIVNIDKEKYEINSLHVLRIVSVYSRFVLIFTYYKNCDCTVDLYWFLHIIRIVSVYSRFVLIFTYYKNCDCTVDLNWFLQNQYKSTVYTHNSYNM
jgi:hypothetical protein